MVKLWSKTVTQLGDLLKRKEISATDITRSVLSRISQVESDVRAYVTLTSGEAMKAAEKVDAALSAGDTRGPLAGIPVAVKDNICTEGVRTTCASRMLEDFVPPYDATIVGSIKQAGSIMVGKTNMDELAMGSSTETSAFFPTHNPWDLSRVPGGSSGGSAAAVASGEAIFALGSDTGGSIRQPAAFCSVVGFKPSYGQVSRFGLIALASSLDQAGCFTRDVSDCALVLNALVGKDELDSTTARARSTDYTNFLNKGVKGLKIGIPSELIGEGVDSSVKEHILRAAKVFEDLGAVVEEMSLSWVQYSPAVYYLITPAEASSGLARLDGVRYGLQIQADNIDALYKESRTAGFGPEVRRRIVAGTYVLGADQYKDHYEKAQQVRTLIVRDFAQAFSSFDILLTPTSPVLPFKLGEKIDDPLKMYLMDICTIPVNLAGLPGISVPCGFSDGLPVGMQLLAKPFADELLIQAAAAFEQATDHHKHRPVLTSGGGSDV